MAAASAVERRHPALRSWRAEGRHGKIAVLGFGTVGSVAQVLEENRAAIATRLGGKSHKLHPGPALPGLPWRDRMTDP